MIHSGLVSITFSKLEPREIINLVKKAGLKGIEWGGNIHVPHGNVKVAREVYKMTVDAGLKVSSYGSYYRVGNEEEFSFEAVVETAKELHVPTVRVWAGERGSADADAKYRNTIVSESRRIADMAGASGMTISYEFHGGTLTDTNESALNLLKEVKHDNVKTYWQPVAKRGIEYGLEGLRGVLPWLTNVHTFYWFPSYDRCPLADGTDVWGKYLQVVASTGRDHYLLIEFVRDDSPEVFLKDAETLKSWVESVK